jgi:hypothetical protein
MRYTASIFFLIWIILFVNCELFNPREPEDPSGSSGNWTPPANPREVLENISSSFTLHDGILYLKSFAKPNYIDTAFVFIPDVSVPSYDSTIFTEWDYDTEQAFILTLFSPDFIPSDSSASIYFQAISEPPGEITPVYREKYTLTIHSTEDLPSEYSGYSDIRFDRNYNSEWVITSWIDEKIEGVPSLTELKSAISH